MKPKQSADYVKQLNTPNEYVWEVIATYLCRVHNVSDVSQIQPFGTRTYGWEIMRDVVLQTQFTTPERVAVKIRETDPETSVISCAIGNGGSKMLSNPQPKDDEKFKHPITKEPLEVDLDNVFIYNITCRHAKMSIPVDMAVRLNYYHASMAALQDTVEQDIMFKESGAVRGAFTVIKPTPAEGVDIESVPMPELQFAYQNRQFIKTMALLNEQNLMNGIIKIPHDVCLAAKLPIWKGDPEPDEAMITTLMKSMGLDENSSDRQHYVNQWKTDVMDQFKDATKSDCFYAIPINHVLAWGYSSEQFMEQRGHRVEHFRFTPATQGTGQSVVLYFLVASAYFDNVLSVFKEKWLGKLDRRPLKDVGFEFLPILKQSYEGIPDTVDTVTGQIAMRAYITFSAAPKLNAATIANLAPALSIDFPSCHNWSVDEIAKQMALEKHLHESRAAKPIKKK